MCMSTAHKRISNDLALKVEKKNKMLQRKKNYIQQQANVGKNNQSYLVNSEVETKQSSEEDTVLDPNIAIAAT